MALARNGGDVVVSVEDGGSGIDPEDANSVFDPFYRAAKTSAVSGVGIGLTVCKRLVESQQGRIWIETSGSAARWCASPCLRRSTTATRSPIEGRALS